MKLSAQYVNNPNRRRMNQPPPPETNTHPIRVTDPHDPDSYRRSSKQLHRNERRMGHGHNIVNGRRANSQNNAQQRDEYEFITNSNRITVESTPNIHQRRMDPHTNYHRRMDPPDSYQRTDPHTGRRMNYYPPYNTEQRNANINYASNNNSNNNNRIAMDPSTSTKEELLQYYDLKEILIRTNPYEILQIPSNSNNIVDKDELKSAYRKLAFRFHPDVVIGDNNKVLANDAFAKINEAYNTLLNGRSRNSDKDNENNVATAHHDHNEPAAVGQYEEEYFYPRGEEWYQKYKERERAMYTEFDPAEYGESSDNSVGSIFTEMIEYVNE